MALVPVWVNWSRYGILPVLTVVDTPHNKLAVGTIGKKYIFAHTALPPTPTKKSTRIYSLGWAGIKVILSLYEAFAAKISQRLLLSTATGEMVVILAGRVSKSCLLFNHWGWLRGWFPTPDYPWDLANSAYFTINAAKSSSTCRISLSRLVRAAGEHHAWSWQSPSFRNF